MVLWYENILGYDTDSLFALTTEKVVWVRNRWIGGLYYTMVLGVVLWVFVVRILVRNDHFLRKDVSGVARMWYSHPTRENCESSQEGCLSDFKRLTELPYCDVYKGSDTVAKPGPCKFNGKITLVPGGSSDNVLFIPTAVEVVTERRACNPSLNNSYTCPNEYEALRGVDCLRSDTYLCKSRGGLSNQFYYVADATDFKVQFTTSYDRDDIRGTSLMHHGRVSICDSSIRASTLTRTWLQRQRKRKTCIRRLTPPIPCSGSSCRQLTNQSYLNKFLSSTGLDYFQRGDDEQSSLMESLTGDADKQEEPLPRAIAETISTHPSQSGVKADAPFGPRRARAFIQVSSASVSQANHSERGNETMSSETSSRAAPAEGKSYGYSNAWGDVFSLSELLELAGVDLDKDANMDGWSAREAGMALEVAAVYHNLTPFLSSFGYRPIRYHYEVRELMLPYVSRTQLSPVQPADYPATRRYEVRYGVLIHFKVAGTFGFFNVAYFLLMLTTTFALMATARTVTDQIALHLHPHRENFFRLKYEVSPDFSECWKCHKCGYLNKQEDRYCKGLPRWMSAEETTYCGEARILGPSEER